MGHRYDSLQSIIQAWQAKDIDAVLAHMADDIVWHYAAPALPPVVGKVAAAKLLRRLQVEMHDIQWRIFAYAETADRLFIEGVDEYVAADGKRMATPYAGVMEFRGDLVTGWRDYVDIGVIGQQKDGQPLSPQVEALLARPAA